MKNLIYVIGIISLISSCKSGWSVQDQEEYTQDCMAMSQGVDNAEIICECGLEKAMQNYATKEEAEKAIQNMNEEELHALFAECM